MESAKIEARVGFALSLSAAAVGLMLPKYQEARALSDEVCFWPGAVVYKSSAALLRLIVGNTYVQIATSPRVFQKRSDGSLF